MTTTVKTAISIAVVIALALAVWLIRPLFVDSVVDEGFPAASSSPEDDTPEEAAAADAEAADAEAADADGSADEEAFPLSSGAEVPDDMTQEDVEAEMAAAAAEPDVEQVEEMPADEPTVVVQGSFEGADASHSGEGSATVYALPDGQHVLRFEDFNVTNGPDLRVYLAPLDADGVPDVHAESVELGRLKGNIGNQNYDIPAEFDLDQPLGVVIYCQPFSVTFATALLA